jgi:hypothetical protein
MAEWMKSNPSAIVRIVLSGNRDLAGRYIGEAMNFLHILKNNMNLGGINALVSNHILPDGTEIRVRSTYGQDQVTINSPTEEVKRQVSGVSEEQECTILLKSFPDIIQPMWHPGEIHPGEVKDTDYIKTYFNFDTSKCTDCNDVHLKFSFKYLHPTEVLVYHNPKTGLDELTNH